MGSSVTLDYLLDFQERDVVLHLCFSSQTFYLHQKCVLHLCCLHLLHSSSLVPLHELPASPLLFFYLQLNLKEIQKC